MNLDFLKALGNQLAAIWRDIKVYQKFTVVVVASVLMGLMVFLVVNAASTRYTQLYPSDRITVTDASEIKAYLDGASIEYQIRSDRLILVPETQVHQIRMDLAAVGLPKKQRGAGFELFDTNTWIKGEKELQILEMRALKGQLERDIAEYENIRQATVVLDPAPPRPFGGTMYRTKASVILDLMPGARLNQSQLRAITFHVSGAVRGLLPNMIAISDTTGKLYQPIDPDGNMDLLSSAEMAQEEHLKAKVDGLLAMIVGPENYYTSVQVVMNREKTVKERKVYSGVVDGINLGDPVIASVTESGLQMTELERAEVGTPGTNTEAVAGAVSGSGQEILNRSENRNQQYRQMAVPMDHVKIASVPGHIDSVSVSIMVDKTIIVDGDSEIPEDDLVDGRRDTSALRVEIENQLNAILLGYEGAETTQAVDFVEFDKTRFNKNAQEQSWLSAMDLISQVGTVLLIIFVFVGMFWTFNRFWKRHMEQPPQLPVEEEEEEPEFSEEPSLVEVEAMIEAIKTRLHSDPTSVIETMREWVVEEEEFYIPTAKEKK